MSKFVRWAAACAASLAVAGCRTGAVDPSTADAPAAAAAPVVAAPAPATLPVPWWKNAVFYEVFLRSFADSTTGPLANDGIGDFQGLIERLDYLNDGDPATTTDLGVTGLWLMPINPSPSYHGYDVTDYYGINPQYGTRADFERLLAECHRRGIRVIVDLVLNHSSSRHPAFQAALRGDAAHRDWYLFVPPDRVPDVEGPWDQVVWHEARGLHYYGIFWSGMPDLNYRNPAVTAEAYRIAAFWLTEMRVDGFRLDAIRHLIEDGDVMSDTPETIAWLQGFRKHVRSVDQDALVVGEVWTTTDTVSQYLHADALDLAFEFDLGSAFLDAVRTGDGTKLAYALDEATAAYPDARYATILTNHDQNRVASELGEVPARLALAATLLLTAPGVPFIYYGEEIGQVGAKPDEMIRNPMPWTPGPNGGFTQAAQPWEPLQDGHERRNVATLDADPDSLLHHYRRLVRLRQAEPALSRGSYRRVDTGRDDVIAWQREFEGRRLVVVANLSGREIRDFALPSDAPVTTVDLITGQAVVSTGRLSLAAYTAVVLADGG
ncbi:MAG: DUF3459 domain-containing protein [Lysobacterales bacterium]|jgi:glycosidase|nr:MAG: DUF3459 domain-containing protein [Xanthomonadales bacterium]